MENAVDQRSTVLIINKFELFIGLNKSKGENSYKNIFILNQFVLNLNHRLTFKNKNLTYLTNKGRGYNFKYQKIQNEVYKLISENSFTKIIHTLFILFSLLFIFTLNISNYTFNYDRRIYAGHFT